MNVIEITNQPNREDVAYLHECLKWFNNTHSPHHREGRKQGKQPLAVFMRNEQGKEILGGLVAATYWQWLDIDYLWVQERWRRVGMARQMMEAAEKVARERGCVYGQVKTWGFQARGFYEKMGYVVVGELVDFPVGQTLYWLRKNFLGLPSGRGGSG